MDLLADLRVALTLLDPVPDAVVRDAESAIAALRYPPDRVVGMGYFPDELGLPVASRDA